MDLKGNGNINTGRSVLHERQNKHVEISAVILQSVRQDRRAWGEANDGSPPTLDLESSERGNTRRPANNPNNIPSASASQSSKQKYHRQKRITLCDTKRSKQSLREGCWSHHHSRPSSYDSHQGPLCIVLLEFENKTKLRYKPSWQES